MKKTILFAACVACLAGCQKKDTTVNNYTTTGQPAFVVNGITDMTMVNDVSYGTALTITLQYQDSAQENVALSVTGMPAGITMDTSWISSGIPTYSTTLTLFDTNAVGVTPGTYPIALTATSASGKKKNYPFNIKILGMPTGFLGKYNNCSTSCGGATPYTDSLYADDVVANKVWFANFANTGQRAYGIISNPEMITIPSQTVGGTVYYTTGNEITLGGHSMLLNIHKGGAGCVISMN